MSLLGGGKLDRRGFLKTTAATAMAAGMPMSGALAMPKRGGHLRVARGHGQTTDAFDPGIWDNGYMLAFGFAVHGRLTEVLADGSLGPELAESWEGSADAKEWRFKLRKGVTFHNGKPLTQQDVINSINHHRGEDSKSAAKPLVEAVTDVVAEGSDVVLVKLGAADADFPFTLSDYHIVICPAKGDGIDWQSGIGCGSYAMKNFDPGVTSTYERHSGHWRDDVAWFDSFEMLSVIDANARTTALVTGDVDAIDRVDLKAAGLLGRRPGIDIKQSSGTQHYTFAMSTNKSPYDDNNVRQALKYAIDRQELVDKILFGYGSVGNDHPIGRGQQFFNSELEQKVYDPDKAKWYLKQAGLTELDVSLHASDAAFAGSVDAATLFQATASKAGINLNVVREPKDGYWSDVWMKKPFAAVYWGGRPVEAQMFATAYECGASWNDSFWCNNRFDKLLVDVRAETNQDRRRQMYYEMQDIVANQGGVVIPMFADYVMAASEKVGHGDMASNWEMDGERWMERWWFT